MGRCWKGLFLLSVVFSFTEAQQSGWGNPWIMGPPTTSTAFGYVTVIAANNSLLISESIPVDRNVTAVLRYTGTIPPTLTTPSSKFDLVQSTNEGEMNLVLKANIDYETNNQIEVLVFRIDLTFQTLSVIILDENDNTPFIKNFNSSAVYPENKKGTIQTFRATDSDAGDETRLEYTLNVLSGSSSYFQLNTVTENGKRVANLDAVKELDYESETFYLFEITVRDRPSGEAGGLSSSVQIALRVQDVGDEPPRWKTQLPLVRIPEEQPLGTPVFKVVAEDGDVGVRNRISYSLFKSYGYFHIDESSGQISIEQPIDRDRLTENFFELTIIATEVEDPASKSNTTSSVFIDDINDNSPAFSGGSYFVNVSENYVGRLPLEDIWVFDPDLGVSGSYTVQFQGDPSVTSKLSMTPANGKGLQNTTYYISISSGLLDYDDPAKRSVTFTLVVTEDADTTHTSTATVVIDSYDVNDNAPQFVDPPSGGFKVEIPENAAKGYPVLKVQATDIDTVADYGSSSIRFFLLQNDGITLAIDSVTGEITVAAENVFDREKTSSLAYTIQIIDNFGNGQRNAIDLTVTLKDINDTPPRFQTQNFPLDVALEENSSSGSVLIPNISAEDVDLNPSLDFSINWAKTVFTKNRVPVAPNAQNRLQEYFAIQKTRIGRMSATAKLTVGAMSPDREVADAAEVYIVVKDANTQSPYGSTDEVGITVTIRDVNDNPPKFDNGTWSMAITENANVGSFIGSVHAEDVDADNVITYVIESCGQGANLVEIDSSSGRITVSDDIDREVIPKIICTLSATDSGTPAQSSTSALEIKILDQNDNAPEIVEKPLEPIKIKENSPTNQTIGRVRAIDKDEGAYGTVKYLFSAFNTEGFDHFSVDLDTGDIWIVLKNNQTLDFEQKRKYSFKVEARDNYNPNFIAGSLSSYADIVVELEDENDEPPQLPSRDPFSCFAETYELTIKDSLVTTFIATDKDEPNSERSRITYELLRTQPLPGTVPNVTNLFRIENKDNQGILRVDVDSLTNLYGNYSVAIMAKDHGTPSKNTTLDYRICVIDSNDNSPQFTFPAVDNLRVDIYENQTVGQGRVLYITNNGTKELVVSAADKDQLDNGRVFYSLTGDPGGYFFLDPVDGFFVLQKPLNRTNIFQYTLALTAQDAGSPPRSETRNMIIYVRGVSKYLPEFPGQTEMLNFTENILASVPFTPATDKDNINTEPGDQEEICYFIVGGSKNFRDYFSIPNPRESKVALIKTLDRESSTDRDMHVLIEATNLCLDKPPDADEPSISRVKITLGIIDQIDSPPVFTRNYTGGISTGDKKDRTVLAFAASDPDLADTLTYSLGNDVTASHPSIDAIVTPFKIKDREIILNFDVQNNMEGLFSLDLNVADSAGLQGRTRVKIYIVTQANKVTFSFNNTFDKVESNRDNIADIFTSVYGYTCNVEKIGSSGEMVKASGDNFTIVYSHFVDSKTDMPVLSTEIENMKNDPQLNIQLISRFQSIGLYLVEVKSLTDVTNPQQQLFLILFIVVCIALVPLILLLVIMVIRGNQMNRKIKALSATTFGSQDSGLNRLGASVPNTNKHTLEGSNPMWNVDSGAEPRHDADNISESSGDSILIGVEDNPEFRNYNGAARSNFGQERNNPYEKVTRKNPLAERSAGDSDSYSNNNTGYANKSYEPEPNFEEFVRNPTAWDSEESKTKKRPAPKPPVEDESSEEQNNDSDGGSYEQEFNSNFSFGGSNLTSL